MARKPPNPLVLTGSGAGGAGVSGLSTADGGTALSDNKLVRGDGTTGIQSGLASEDDSGNVVVNGLLVYAGANQSADEKVQVGATTLLASDVPVRWYNDPDISSGTAHVGLDGATAGTLKVTNGAAGKGALDAGQLTVDNVDVNGNTIKNTDNNSNLTFDTTGAGGRFNWNINAVTKMDFTDIGSGAFALRNQSGPYTVPAGSYTGSSSSNKVQYANGGNWVDVVANGTVGLRVTDAGSIFGGSAKFKGFTSSAGVASTTEYPADKDFGLHKNTSLGAVSLAYNDGGVIKSVTLT